VLREGELCNWRDEGIDIDRSDIVDGRKREDRTRRGEYV